MLLRSRLESSMKAVRYMSSDMTHQNSPPSLMTWTDTYRRTDMSLLGIGDLSYHTPSHYSIDNSLILSTSIAIIVRISLIIKL